MVSVNIIFSAVATLIVVLLIAWILVKSERIKALEVALEDAMAQIEALNKRLTTIQAQVDKNSHTKDIKPSESSSSSSSSSVPVITPKEKSVINTAFSDLKRLGKSAAIYFINNDQDRYALTTSNTRFANINATVPVWWFDIPTELFKQDLHLILKGKRQLYWLRIPKGTFDLPQQYFYIRQDNGKVQLRISTERGNYFMRDIAPMSRGVGFEKYVVKEYN